MTKPWVERIPEFFFRNGLYGFIGLISANIFVDLGFGGKRVSDTDFELCAIIWLLCGIFVEVRKQREGYGQTD
jgi:hypothetical protein